jgi:hypothetical protein
MTHPPAPDVCCTPDRPCLRPSIAGGHYLGLPRIGSWQTWRQTIDRAIEAGDADAAYHLTRGLVRMRRRDVEARGDRFGVDE